MTDIGSVGIVRQAVRKGKRLCHGLRCPRKVEGSGAFGGNDRPAPPEVLGYRGMTNRSSAYEPLTWAP